MDDARVNARTIELVTEVCVGPYGVLDAGERETLLLARVVALLEEIATAQTRDFRLEAR